MYKKICFFVASGGGVGYAPFASGTIASFYILPFAFIFIYFGGIYGILCSAFLCFVLGMITSKEVLKHTEHDPSLIIIDEFAGQLFSFIFVAEYLYHDISYWWLYCIAFFAFRFFDIVKPQPAKWADRKLLNAWGVMLDDVFAGTYAAALLYFVLLITGN